MDVNEHERLSNITLMFNYIHMKDTNESEGYGCK